MTNKEVSDWLYRIRSKAEVCMGEAQNAKAKEAVATAIKDLEKQKTGHWVKIDPYPMQMHEYKCSECYHETDDNTENYCSECGARMV